MRLTQKLAILAAFSGVVVTPADARTIVDREAVLLAQTCLREAGWEITDDCAAIHYVILNREARTGVRYVSMIRAYSKPNPGAPWIEQLGPSLQKPRDWPRELQWPVYRERWSALLSHARDVVSGALEPACVAEHFGDHYGDRERALRYGWINVECGNARNLFWRTRASRYEVLGKGPQDRDVLVVAGVEEP